MLVKSKYAWEPAKPGVYKTNQKGLHYEVFKQQSYSAVMAASLKMKRNNSSSEEENETKFREAAVDSSQLFSSNVELKLELFILPF